MTMIIKLCENYPNKEELLKELVLNFPDAKIKVKSCISMCKYCETQPTLKVNGKKIKKKSIEKIISALLKKRQ